MRPHRRRFLAAVLGTGASLGLGVAAWRKDSSSGLSLVSRTSRALGTEVKITALHADRDTAEQAIAAAFAELETVEQVMSIYRPASQLSRLNREHLLNDPHLYLLDVLLAARNMSERSGGAFDITVQPLWVLFAQAQQEGRLPNDDEVAAACQTIDWRRVEWSLRSIRLRGEGTAITLNGIAQGFAADRAAFALGAHGVEHALVNTGELRSLGHKEHGEPWRAGIQHPRRADAYVALARLEGRSLATSGDYNTTFGGDSRYNHIFDPHTGRSPSAFASVSVAAPTAMTADALSTALFVLEPDAALALVESTPGADALFVLKDGRTLATRGFPQES